MIVKESSTSEVLRTKQQLKLNCLIDIEVKGLALQLVIPPHKAHNNDVPFRIVG